MATLTVTETYLSEQGAPTSTYQIVDGKTYAIAYSTDTTDAIYTISTTISGVVTYVPFVGESTIKTVQRSDLFNISTSAAVSSVSTRGANTPLPPASPSTAAATGPSPTPASSSKASATTGGSSAATTTGAAAKPTSQGRSNVGAYVGAAIGGLVVGALIAGLIAFFIMSRRQKKHRSAGGGYGRDRYHSSQPSNEKALPSAPLLGGGVVGNWEKHLDQPESDNTITRSVKGLFDHIEMHVENFYRDAPIPITPDLSASLMTLKSSRDLPDEPAGLLSQTDRPTLLIKHCIAYATVEHIDYESGVPDSFLPVDFTALPMALMTRSRSTSGKPGYHQAYSRWRVLSSYLRPKPAEDPSYTHTRDAHITNLADQLCRTFEPWALSRDNFAGRRQNLVDIMKVGTETGVLLFSQPGTFRWRWGRRDGGGGKSGMPGKVTVVVLPGVEKVKDEEARAVEPGVVLVRAVEGVLTG